MLFLAEPSVIFRDSFIQSVHEFQAEGRQLHYDLKSITSDFGAFCRRFSIRRIEPG